MGYGLPEAHAPLLVIAAGAATTTEPSQPQPNVWVHAIPMCVLLATGLSVLLLYPLWPKPLGVFHRVQVSKVVAHHPPLALGRLSTVFAGAEMALPHRVTAPPGSEVAHSVPARGRALMAPTATGGLVLWCGAAALMTFAVLLLWVRRGLGPPRRHAPSGHAGRDGCDAVARGGIAAVSGSVPAPGRRPNRDLRRESEMEHGAWLVPWSMRTFRIVVSLPLAGRVNHIPPDRRFGFVRGARGDAYVPRSLLGALQIGDEVTYSTVPSVGHGCPTVSRLQRARAPYAGHAELQETLKAEDACLARGSPSGGGPTTAASRLAVFEYSHATRELALPGAPGVFRRPELPMFLPRAPAGAAQQLERLPMDALLRVTDLQGVAVGDYDAVCVADVLLVLMDMTVDATGTRLDLAWAGMTSGRLHRRHMGDIVLFQRWGRTLFLALHNDDRRRSASFGKQFEKGCVEAGAGVGAPASGCYSLNAVQILDIAALVASSPDAVSAAGDVVEIKLSRLENLGPRDATQCLLQMSDKVFCGDPEFSEAGVAVHKVHLRAAPKPPVAALKHLRRMLSFLRRTAAEEGVLYGVQRMDMGIVVGEMK